MLRYIRLSLVSAVLATSVCSGPAASAAESEVGYMLLDAGLSRLRDDFNADAGKVRLLYIVGPTCPVCLRGMDDLGTTLAPERGDPRLQTFVVYVPELHAKPADIGPTVSLLPGKQVSRYWDASGASEKLFEGQLKTIGPAWDVYMVYGPGRRWEGTVPPMPDFWMAQLGGLPEGRYLDATEFAVRVKDLLASPGKRGI